MSWTDERLTAFDIETTGVDVEEARIVTAAVCHVGGGLDTYARSWLINPGVPIPEEASAVHGITTEEAVENGQDPQEAIELVIYQLTAWPGPIIAYNAPFDLTILDREARRYGLPPLPERYVIDPFVIDKYLDRYRKGSRKLADTCLHYGVGFADAHDATADALGAARLAWVLGRRGELKRRVRNAEEGREKARLVKDWNAIRHDAKKLHEAQIKWYAEQAKGLSEHLARKGEPADVSTSWPKVTMKVAA